MNAHRNSSSRPPRAVAGLTLVEIAVSTLVVSLGLLAAMSALTQSVSTKVVHAADPAIAYSLAEEIHALSMGLPSSGWDGTVAAGPADITTLQDLGGASFSPPVSAQGHSLGDLSAWNQEVALAQVSLGDPTAAPTEADGEAWIWELSVKIYKSNVLVGDYRWWVSP